MISTTLYRLDLVLLVSLGAIAAFLFYLGLLVVMSRTGQPEWKKRNYRSYAGEKPEVIFLMPCLNEATVVKESVRRLLSIDYPNLHVVVIDDGSDDGTGDVVRSIGDPRITLFQRALPEARQGKGRALNAAFQFIYDGGVNPHQDPRNTVIVVVDADGHMDRTSLDYVLPAFDDPELAAVQIGVRINNRRANLLARMQDLEFVLYTEVFQRARVRLSSVGLGGNGQFVRLSALRLLGREPWSDSLTEDLDLGIRLHLTGMRLDYCPKVAVHQQGLESLRRWVRQRTRWFQGYLQSWNQVSDILTKLSGSGRIDIFIAIASPLVLLVVTFFTASFAFWVLAFLIAMLRGEHLHYWGIELAYLVAVGPVLILSLIYLRKESGLGVVKAVALSHLYVVYAQLWGLAGWSALWNQVRGKKGWAKTERIVGALEADTQDDPSLQPQTSEAVVMQKEN